MEIGDLAVAAAARVGVRLAGKWRLDRLDRLDVLAASYAATNADGKSGTVRVVHDGLAGVEEVTQPFVAVARMAAAIPHPDVVPFLDQGCSESGSPFVVLGCFAGETLADFVVRRPGRVPPAEALRIVSDVLSMLMAAHAEGLVHGSVRPDQVLLAETGAARLIGFGSRSLQRLAMRHLGLDSSLEVAAFTPPELARNPDARATGSCDVWGAAALLFHLLTGETVHCAPTVEAQFAALAARSPRPLRELAPQAPPALERAAKRGLALSPRERFASARSMRATLSHVMELPEVMTLRGLRSSPAGPPSSRDAPPSQRPTPDRFEGIANSRRGGERPLSAPPLHARPVPLPQTPTPLAHRHATASYELVDAGNVVVAPGRISPSATNPTARAITLPALPQVDAGPGLGPRSSRDGAIARYLGSAWTAKSGGEDATSWILRLAEITQARMAAEAAVPVTIDVLPWGLREGETDAWEADLGLLPIVHRLYAGGLRSFVIEHPLDASDATTLVDLPFLLGDSGPGSDMRCALWSTRVGRLQLTLDDEVEMRGDQLRFAEERREVLALARFDTAFQLEDCWQSAERRRPKQAAGVWRAAHQGALGPLYSFGLSPEGLRDDFRARLTSQIEAEATLEPQRLDLFRRTAAQARIGSVAPPMLTRPERHDARLSVVVALCRVVELAGANVRQETVEGAVDALFAALGQAREVGEDVVDIAPKAEVFAVSGEPLRAGRAVHAAADGMAQVLLEQGVGRLQLRTDVERSAVVRFQELSANSVLGQPDGLLDVSIPGVHVEAVDERPGVKRSRTPGGSLETYAGALVALRGFYAGMSQRAPAELRWVRRIAHRLVDVVLVSEGMPRSALALAHTHREPAARALHTALLALVSAKQLTSNREVLSRVALAALLRNVAEAGERELADAHQPAKLAALCLSVGGGCPEALAGVVAAFGAAWLDRALGPMGDLSPLLTSRIVFQVGQLVDVLSQEEPHRSPAEALRELLELPDCDRECLCLLVAAVGALPVGTIVELDNGAWGVVVEPSLDPEQLDRPTVRLLSTTAGHAVDRPALADLRRTGSGGPQRVARLVPSQLTRFNIVQSLSMDE